MRKRLALLSALIMLSVLVLPSCHGSRSTEPFVIPDTFEESKEYEITFWAKNDTNKTQVAIYKEAIEGFEALYPNIKINMRLYTDYGRIYNDVITNIATKTTPNVCITYPDHIATYMTGVDTIVPLDELMTDGRFGLGGSEVKFDSPRKDEIIASFLDECVIGDHYYALPFMRSTEACYVNKTYVEKLGYELPEKLTWDFVLEVSAAAAEKDADGVYKINGQNVMIPFIYKSTDNMMIQMTEQLGSGYSTDDGEITLFNDTTKELLLDLAGYVEKGAFSTFKISSYPANFLNAGQCVFAIDSTAGATWMGPDAPNSDIAEDKFIDYELAVMEVPQFDTASPKMISQGPSVCIFNKDDNGEVLASWLFCQYLLTNDVQIAYSETEGYAPVTSKAQGSAEYTDYLAREGEDCELYYGAKIKATKLLLDNTDNTFVTPVWRGSASLRDAAGQLIENVTKSVRRGEEVDDEYIDALYDDVKSMYRLDGVGRTSGERKEMGELPGASKTLLISLCAVWVLLAAAYIFRAIRNKNAEK